MQMLNKHDNNHNTVACACYCALAALKFAGGNLAEGVAYAVIAFVHGRASRR